jgi:23S rRNA-/tRNA-specific pseudouridylate synthase
MKLMMNYSVYKILKINALISLRNVRNLSSSPMNGYHYEQPKSRSRISSFDSKVNTVGHPYDQLFPWKSLTEFSQHLADNKVYFDGNLLAISKPWGVGIHKVNVNVTDKNSYLSTSFITGSPQYCLTDSIQHLCQIFNVKHLNICKTISRYMSGIVLFATDSQTENKVIRAIRQSQSLESPAMTFWCLTKGWPIINNHQMRERVGIKLLELDELGDHKQPIIISPEQLTNKMRRRRIAQTDGMVVKPALVDLKTIDMNKTLGVSLVELSTNVQK